MTSSADATCQLKFEDHNLRPSFIFFDVACEESRSLFSSPIVCLVLVIRQTNSEIDVCLYLMDISVVYRPIAKVFQRLSIIYVINLSSLLSKCYVPKNFLVKCHYL